LQLAWKLIAFKKSYTEGHSYKIKKKKKKKNRKKKFKKKFKIFTQTKKKFSFFFFFGTLANIPLILKSLQNTHKRLSRKSLLNPTRVINT